MFSSAVSRLSRSLLFARLEGIRDGRLEVHRPGGRVHAFGDAASPLSAVAEIADERAFARFVFGGDIGFGEAYAEGLWDSPDLVSVVRLAVRNLAAFDAGGGILAAVPRAVERLRHHLRRNSVEGSRENIRYHYDLGTDFFSLFLDPSLTYSCGVFENEGVTLEEAQRAKLDGICRRLELAPGMRVLEIGSGWGSFAVHAAKRYGCHVTTTTISRAQHEHVTERIARDGVVGRVRLLLEDYRRLTGRYDRVVSIEMFEAVGLRYYDDFFSAADRLLENDGAMLLQTITMNDAHFERYRRQPDFIQRHIFPGSELASVAEIRRSLARATRLSVAGLEEIGAHYVPTLAAWRANFLSNRPRLRSLGFPESFIRLFDYYLAYCAGGFAERHIGDVQLLLARENARLGSLVGRGLTVAGPAR